MNGVFEPLFEIENPPLHGNVVMELLAGVLRKRGFGAKGEDLTHRLFVAETGDVVKRLAAGGLEVETVGV